MIPIRQKHTLEASEGRWEFCKGHPEKTTQKKKETDKEEREVIS